MQTQEFPKLVVKNLKIKSAYAQFKDNILTAGLAEIGSLSSLNPSEKYLLCHRCFYQICLG